MPTVSNNLPINGVRCVSLLSVRTESLINSIGDLNILNFNDFHVQLSKFLNILFK